MSEEARTPMVSKLRGYIALAVLFVGLAGVAVGYVAIAVEAVAALL
mgnify:CR=1 FL=1